MSWTKGQEMSSVKLVFNCVTVSVWCVGLARINRPVLGTPGSAGEDVQHTVEGMHNNKWLFQSSPVWPSVQVCQETSKVFFCVCFFIYDGIFTEVST